MTGMKTYFILSEEPYFPSPEDADPDGILAVGGDLGIDRLLLAYRNGIFPWYNEDEPILWWSPDPRFVLFPDKIRISKSLKQCMRNMPWEIRENTNFRGVIENCRKIYRPRQKGTWIHEELENQFITLHQMGFAKSIEVWEGKEMVGGLYGMEIGKVFCGESMFSKKSNTSKIALVYLAQKKNYLLIDCQVATPHLETMGAEYIPRKDFLNFLGTTGSA